MFSKALSIENNLYYIEYVDRVFSNNPYRLFIAEPKHNFNGTTLYLLDGNMHFPKALNAVNREKALPRIVAIGYVGEEKYFVPERTRDYTPKVEGKDFSNGGGADNFMEIIIEDVKPYITNQYGDSKKTLFFGHSFGGLFGLYTLFTKSDFFDGYILASPSLWWGKSSWLEGKKITYKPDFVLLTLGEYEEHPELDPNKDPERIKRILSRKMDFNLKKLNEELRKKGISSEFILIPKTNHGTSIQPALRLALEKAQSKVININ